MANKIAHTREHRIDQLESLINLLTHFGASQNNLTADEDQEHNLGLHHTVDETREEFGLVGAEVVVARSQTLQADGEFDITGTDDVLDLEVRELGVETEFLDDTSVLAGSKLGVILRLGTGDDHLARGEDQSGGLGLTDTHDDGGKTLGRKVQPHCPLICHRSSGRCGIYLWIVLCIACVQRNGLQIQAAVKVDGGHDVS
jgi:hypothetical protein